MKKLLSLFLVLALLLAGCTPSTQSNTSNSSVSQNEDTVITVGDEVVSVDTFMIYYNMYTNAYTRYMGEGVLNEEYDGVKFTDILKNNIQELLVNDLLVKQFVLSQGKNFEQSDVDAQLAELKSYIEQDSQTKELYEKIGVTDDFLRNQVESSIYVTLFEQILKDEITSDEALLNSSYSSEVVSVKAKNILLATAEEAEAALTKLQGGAVFEDLAKEVSIDSNAQEGGALGYVYKGELEPSFEQAAFTAAVGEFVGPVETSIGYHIIVVEETRTLSDLIALGESENIINTLKEELILRLVSDSYDIKVAELKENAEITVDLSKVKELTETNTDGE